MNTKHLATNFVAPVFFYLAIVCLFIALMCVLAFVTTDPAYLIMGLVMFLLSYNSWDFGQKLRKP